MKCLLLFLLLCTPAFADNWERLPRPYNLNGVVLSWSQIPYPRYGYSYETGWELKNPDSWACEPWFDSRNWFQTRLRVDPLLWTITIQHAAEIESPW